MTYYVIQIRISLYSEASIAACIFCALDVIKYHSLNAICKVRLKLSTVCALLFLNFFDHS